MTNEATYQPCYRHPDRSTGIGCQRCRRPICGECMRPASVGFQCPSCGGSGGSSGPRQRQTSSFANSGLAARIRFADTPATWVLIGISLLVSLLAYARLTSDLLSWVPGAALWGPLYLSFWISLPWGLLSLFVIWVVGRHLEPALGRVRFTLLFLVTGIGASLFLYLFAGSYAPGGSSVALGLIAASATTKLKTGEDMRPDLILLGLLVGLQVLVSFRSGLWLNAVGAIVFAGIAMLIIMFVKGRNQERLQVGLLLGLAALGLLGHLLPSLAA